MGTSAFKQKLPAKVKSMHGNKNNGPIEPGPTASKQEWLDYYAYHLNELVLSEKIMQEKLDSKLAELVEVQRRTKKQSTKIDDHINELTWMQKESAALDDEYCMKIADAQEERKSSQKTLTHAEKELEQLKNTIMLYDTRQTVYNEKMHRFYILEKTLGIIKSENDVLLESAAKVQIQKDEEEAISDEIRVKIQKCEDVRLDFKVQRTALDAEIRELKIQIEHQKVLNVKHDKKKSDVNRTCEELRSKILTQVKELGDVHLKIIRTESQLSNMLDDLEEAKLQIGSLTEENKDLTEKWKTCEEERAELEIKQNQIAFEYEQDLKLLRKELRDKGNLIASNLKTLVNQMEVLTNEMGKSGGDADYTLHEIRKNMRKHRKQMADISQQLKFKDGIPISSEIKEVIEAQEVKNEQLLAEKEEVDKTIIDLCKNIRIHTLRLQKIESQLTAPVKE